MKTRTSRFGRTSLLSSSTNAALGLLVIGSIVSSLLLISFHIKSPLIVSETINSNREQNLHFDAPIITIPTVGGEEDEHEREREHEHEHEHEHGSSVPEPETDSSFRRWSAAKARTIFVSDSPQPAEAAKSREHSTNNPFSVTLPDAAGNNTGGSYSTNADATKTRTTASLENEDENENETNTDGCLVHLNSKSWLEGKRLGNQNSSDSRIIDKDYVVSSILNLPFLFFNNNNENDENKDEDEAHSQSILRHTLCAETSRFRNVRFSTSVRNGDETSRDRKRPSRRSDTDTEDDLLSATELVAGNRNRTRMRTRTRTIHQLSLRLLYLSVHVHQHKDAIGEAEHRLGHPELCDREMKSHGVGAFDFECPDAQFLVVPLKHSGLGGQARLIAALALVAGISSDRVVVFANNSPVGPSFLREPWDLASCPRRDKQCFFLPDTPCVLTHDEIRNATVVGKSERRALFKTGLLPEHVRGDRVVVMNTIDRPQRIPPNFRARIADIANTYLIDPLAARAPNDPRLPLLAAAADHILEDGDDDDDDGIGDSFYYFGRNFQAHHAMVFFALRPKLEYAERIDRILESTLGNSTNHRTDLSLGLPIRASDKCIDESECPPFGTYVSLMQSVWDSNEKELDDARRRGLSLPDYSTTTTTTTTNVDHAPLHTNIILTSESSDVMNAQKAFEDQSRSSNNNNRHSNNLSFPFKFVTNRFDVLPNTGNPSKLSESSEHSPEEVLLSALASLKIQLYAKYTVGNCCSNHHLLLFDFLKEGCGAGDMDHVATCMQDHEDARFRICCGWTKTEECVAKRLERETLRLRNATVTPLVSGKIEDKK